MGPGILIDKSTFQSLSKDEVFYLQYYYYVIFCPTLFYEILGDLTKRNDIEDSKREVAIISYKMNGMDTCFTTDFRSLLAGELFGHKITMDGRPILSGGKEIIDKDGNKGIFFDEQLEYEALRRWTLGKFSEAEKMHAENWRSTIKAADLSTAKINSDLIDKIKNYDDLKEATAYLLNDPDNQFVFLQYLLNATCMEAKYRNYICEEWLKCGMPNIKDIAPYSFYCLTAYMRFYIATAKGLIGPRSSNLIDLEYILYMPFCRVFTSTDKFLRNFSPMFLKDDQVFIWGDDLKKDLKAFCNHWETEGKEARFAYQEQYGNYPPEIPNSLTCKIWKKWAGERKILKKSTPEEKRKIQEKLNSIISQIKDKKNQENEMR